MNAKRLALILLALAFDLPAAAQDGCPNANTSTCFKDYSIIIESTGKNLNEAIADGDLSGGGTGHSDGANCSAGQAPLGVDASGAVQGCFDVAIPADVATDIAAAVAAHAADASAHHTKTIDASELTTGTLPDARLSSAVALDADVTAEIAAAIATKDAASEISFTPYSTIAATDVQAAIQELLDEGGGGFTPNADPATDHSGFAQAVSREVDFTGELTLDNVTPTTVDAGVVSLREILDGIDTVIGTLIAGGDGLGPDGDKGDITVGGTGTTLTIDSGAVTAAKVAADVATQTELDAVASTVTQDDLSDNTPLDLDWDDSAAPAFVQLTDLSTAAVEAAVAQCPTGTAGHASSDPSCFVQLRGPGNFTLTETLEITMQTPFCLIGSGSGIGPTSGGAAGADASGAAGTNIVWGGTPGDAMIHVHGGDNGCIKHLNLLMGAETETSTDDAGIGVHLTADADSGEGQRRFHMDDVGIFGPYDPSDIATGSIGIWVESSGSASPNNDQLDKMQFNRVRIYGVDIPYQQDSIQALANKFYSSNLSGGSRAMVVNAGGLSFDNGEIFCFDDPCIMIELGNNTNVVHINDAHLEPQHDGDVIVATATGAGAATAAMGYGEFVLSNSYINFVDNTAGGENLVLIDATFWGHAIFDNVVIGDTGVGTASTYSVDFSGVSGDTGAPVLQFKDFLAQSITPSSISLTHNATLIKIEADASNRLCNDLDFDGLCSADEYIGLASGTTVPGSCAAGDPIFQDIDATTGQQLYACEGGVYVLQGDGGGGGEWTDVTGAIVPTTVANDVIVGGNGDAVCEAGEVCLDAGTGEATADAFNARDPGDGLRGISFLDNTNDCAEPASGSTALCSVAGTISYRVNGGSTTALGGGAPGTDSIGTTELDDDANTPTAGDFVVVETGAASFDYVTPNAGTDVTADLEEETHASEHSAVGADPITAENLASGCTDAEVLGGDGAGGVECQADSTGGTPAFSAITAGTNSSAAMVVGTGASISISGSGQITANNLASGSTVTSPAFVGTASGNNTIPSSMITNEVRSMYWGAGAISADGTNCADPTEQTLNSGPKVWGFSCADDNASIFYGSTIMPDGWNASTVTFELAVFHGTTETITFAGDFSAQCRGSAEVPSGTWGTAVAADVPITTANQVVHQTTGNVTATGICAAGDMLFWRYVVDAANFSANAANSTVLGVKMEYTTGVGD